MNAEQKERIKFLIAYYEERGADWSIALEYEVRRFNGNLPGQKRKAYQMKNQALEAILAERHRQEVKWGEQNHDPITYLAILTEEVGEFAEAALHTRFGGDKSGGLREEAIHTAAVALAIVECLDRGQWEWPEAAAIRALRTAINSVECASIGPDGEELPWYKQAKAALK